MSCFLCHLVLGAAHGLFGCVWFLGLVLFWFAWLLAVVVGGWVGPGLVFWAVLTVALAGSVLVVWGWLGFCWFCLESLILAQDERWRRA